MSEQKMEKQNAFIIFDCNFKIISNPENRYAYVPRNNNALRAFFG